MKNAHYGGHSNKSLMWKSINIVIGGVGGSSIGVQFYGYGKTL